MSSSKPYVLSMAGFDPSGGAGILADIKTFEAIGCYGLGINTANTIQNDRHFKACYWVNEEIIFEQLHILKERFEIGVVKIGVMEKLSVLRKVLKLLHSYNPEIKIIWDPVLTSSTGFEFQRINDTGSVLDEILENLCLITPNYNEIKSFSEEFSVSGGIEKIKNKCNLYLKGGHNQEKPGWDQLFCKKGEVFTIEPGDGIFFKKHGSGCVLSSAIAANMALDKHIIEACERGKRYTEHFLLSTTTLLGNHNL